VTSHRIVGDLHVQPPDSLNVSWNLPLAWSPWICPENDVLNRPDFRLAEKRPSDRSAIARPLV
jgi:hypothetical protein